MPALSNRKQEEMCHLVVFKGKSRRQAGILVGYSTHSANNIGSLAHVKARIEELEEEKRKKEEGALTFRKEVFEGNSLDPAKEYEWIRAELFQNVLDARMHGTQAERNTAVKMLVEHCRPKRGPGAPTKEERERRAAQEAEKDVEDDDADLGGADSLSHLADLAEQFDGRSREPAEAGPAAE